MQHATERVERPGESQEALEEKKVSVCKSVCVWKRQCVKASVCKSVRV